MPGKLLYRGSKVRLCSQSVPGVAAEACLPSQQQRARLQLLSSYFVRRRKAATWRFCMAASLSGSPEVWFDFLDFALAWPSGFCGTNVIGVQHAQAAIMRLRARRTRGASACSSCTPTPLHSRAFCQACKKLLSRQNAVLLQSGKAFSPLCMVERYRSYARLSPDSCTGPIMRPFGNARIGRMRGLNNRCYHLLQPRDIPMG